MVLRYYGHRIDEQKLIPAMGCTPELGTSPSQISRYLRAIRHKHKQQQNMSLLKLKNYVERGWPIIVAYQAWPFRPSETDLSQTWDNGHYSVVVNVDTDRICLVDPSSRRKRRYINCQAFISQWRDIETAARIYVRWGVAVGPRYQSIKERITP